MNRRQLSNGTHVIHEGLQNNIDIQKALLDITKTLIDISSNRDSHLADIASAVRFQADKLSNISDELFKRHEEEKLNGIKNE